MDKVKSVNILLANHFKLSKKVCPLSKEEIESIPYSSAMRNLMYAMVCKKPNIAHAVGTVTSFISNQRRCNQIDHEVF